MRKLTVNNTYTSTLSRYIYRMSILTEHLISDIESFADLSHTLT